MAPADPGVSSAAQRHLYSSTPSASARTPLSSQRLNPFLSILGTPVVARGGSGRDTASSSTRSFSPDLRQSSALTARSYVSDYSGDDWGCQPEYGDTPPTDDSAQDSDVRRRLWSGDSRLDDLIVQLLAGSPTEHGSVDAGSAALQEQMRDMRDQYDVETHLSKLVGAAAGSQLLVERATAEVSAERAFTAQTATEDESASDELDILAMDACISQGLLGARQLVLGTGSLGDTIAQVSALVHERHDTLRVYGDLLNSTLALTIDLQRASAIAPAVDRSALSEGGPDEPRSATEQVAELVRGFDYVCDAWRGRLLQSHG